MDRYRFNAMWMYLMTGMQSLLQLLVALRCWRLHNLLLQRLVRLLRARPVLR